MRAAKVFNTFLGRILLIISTLASSCRRQSSKNLPREQHVSHAQYWGACFTK